MVGAGSVVTRDVPDFGLAWGQPAKLRGFVCRCGQRLRQAAERTEADSGHVEMVCPSCQERIRIPMADYEQLSER